MPSRELIEGLYKKTELIVQAPPSPAQVVYVNQINKARAPYIAASLVIAVTTSNTLLFSTVLPANVELHAILIIPTSNAQANGVTFYINYGNNQLGSQAAPVGIVIPLTIGFDQGDYPVLSNGQQISCYGQATATGSGLQFIFIGVFV